MAAAGNFFKLDSTVAKMNVIKNNFCRKTFRILMPKYIVPTSSLINPFFILIYQATYM